MAEMKKMLVTGSNGLLGQSIVRKFYSDFYLVGCDLTAGSYNNQYPLKEYHQLDLTRREKVQKYFSQSKPDIIINTAAYTDVDKSEDERDACWAGNVRSVEFVIEAVSDFSPLFVQMSTDYVFDGKNGFYKEGDQTNPVSYYGHTKLAAEKIIRGSGLEYIIARSQVLYGKGENIRNNFVTWVIEQLEKKKKIKVVNDQFGSPTWSYRLALQIAQLIQAKGQGIYHATSEGYCTWYDLAQYFLQEMDVPHRVIPCSTEQYPTPAVRPKNSILENHRLNEQGINCMPFWEEDIHRFVDQFKTALLAEIEQQVKS